MRMSDGIRSLLVLIAGFSALWTDASETIRFRYQAPESVQSVALVADFLGWDTERFQLKKTPGERFFELELPRPWARSIQYKFLVDGKYWTVDPTQSERIPDGRGGVNSLISDTGFRDDTLLELKPGNFAWKRSRVNLETPRGSRGFVVLAPPLAWRRSSRFQSKKNRQEVVVYFQDGGDYLSQAGAAALLANWSQMPEMPIYTGVFVPPQNRMTEYGLTPETLEYEQFLIRQVVPHVESRYFANDSAVRRVLIGPSLGGLVTFHIALRNPSVFDQAVSQSGSFWYRPQETLGLIAQQSDQVVPELFLEVGIWESDKMVQWNRTVKDSLVSQGNLRIHYREYPTTHQWSGWKNRLSEIFRTLARSHSIDTKNY